MSGFLIDTNVLSEYNRRPGGPDAGVKRWLETTDRQSQHVSVITLAEIQKGIELLPEGKRRAQLCFSKLYDVDRNSLSSKRHSRCQTGNASSHDQS